MSKDLVALSLLQHSLPGTFSRPSNKRVVIDTIIVGVVTLGRGACDNRQHQKVAILCHLCNIPVLTLATAEEIRYEN